MKTLLKSLALLVALPICALANFPLPAAADSTAELILSTKCRGDYNVNIWRKYGSGELLYRSTSRYGNLSLGRGTSHAAEGVRIYRFQNGDHEYWLWDGPDSSRSETLQVYKDNRVLMQQLCRQS
jgi:hypothetical protein